MGPWHSCQCKNLFSHSFSSRFVPLCLVSLSVIVSFFFSHPQPYQVLNPQSCSQLRWLSVSLTGMFPTFHFRQISMTIWTPTPAPGLFPRNLRQVRDRKQYQATTQLLVKQTIHKPSLQTSPRSRPRDYTTQDTRALPPPKFRMKSKPPTFHLGGLDALVSTTICFENNNQDSHVRSSCVKDPSGFSNKVYHHQLSSIILPEPHKPPKPKNRWNQTKPKKLSRKSSTTSASPAKIFCEIHDSQFADQHIDRIGDSPGTGGLLMYLACWHCPFPLNHPWWSTTFPHFRLPPRFRPFQEEEKFGIFKNKNGYTHQSPPLDLIKAWPSNTGLPSEAKQSVIFSNQRLVFYLKDLKQRQYHWLSLQPGKIESFPPTPTQPRSSHLDASSLPPWLHSDSVTFSGQKPLSISLQGHILRGISWRTKTSVSGQPWGVCCLGISTRPFQWTLDFQVLANSGTRHCTEPSLLGYHGSQIFLLPSWTDSIPFSTPCSYHHGLALIRYFSQCFWLKPPILTPHQAFLLVNTQYEIHHTGRCKDSSISISNNVPNKDITNNQSNFILVTMFGQVFSSNVTFSSRLVLGGDHLLRRHEVLNNLFQSLLSLHHRLPKKTYSAFRWLLAQSTRPSNIRLTSKQNRPQMGPRNQRMTTHPLHQILTQFLPLTKTFTYLKWTLPS